MSLFHQNINIRRKSFKKFLITAHSPLNIDVSVDINIKIYYFDYIWAYLVLLMPKYSLGCLIKFNFLFFCEWCFYKLLRSTMCHNHILLIFEEMLLNGELLNRTVPNRKKLEEMVLFIQINFPKFLFTSIGNRKTTGNSKEILQIQL